jgi:hypothetical protein
MPRLEGQDAFMGRPAYHSWTRELTCRAGSMLEPMACPIAAVLTITLIAGEFHGTEVEEQMEMPKPLQLQHWRNIR